MTQYARPDNDDSNPGAWTYSTGATLFGVLDETSQSDADYISTNALGYCEIGLSSISDPNSSADHVLKYSYWRNPTNRTITIEVSLYDGATLIAGPWTHANPAGTSTLATQTLTSGEADAISAAGYGGALKVRCNISAIQNSQAYGFIGWIELSTPDVGAQNYILTVGSGSFTQTGGTVNLLATRRLTVDAGSLAVTGGDTNLLHGYRINAGAGNFDLVGDNVNLLTTRKLSIAAGLFTLTGADVNLFRGYRLAIEAGLFSETGGNVNLLCSYLLLVSAGVFEWTGYPVNLAISSISVKAKKDKFHGQQGIVRDALQRNINMYMEGIINV